MSRNGISVPRRLATCVVGGFAAGTLVIALSACASAAAPEPTGQAGTGSSAGAPDTVTIKAFEYAFDPSTVIVQAGQVTFAVTNTGTVEHEFEVLKGDDVVDEVEGLVPGMTRNVTVTLEPGSYTFVCKLTGHEEAGMKGTLTVR